MQPAAKPRRPTGVTILGILDILGGIGLLFVGIVVVLAGILIGTLVSTTDINNQLVAAGYPQLQSYISSATVGTILVVIGVVSLVLGCLALASGIGFFSGRGWAWTLGMIAGVIGIVWAIVQIAFGSYSSLFSLVINGLIVYYLTRPHVKAFFGKTTMMPTATAPAQ